MPSDATPLTGEQFAMLRELTMTAGGLLQRIKPGVLDEAAARIERDLNSVKSMVLSPIARRKGERLVAVLRAAETLRDVCAKAAITFDLIDPQEDIVQ